MCVKSVVAIDVETGGEGREFCVNCRDGGI